MKKEYTHTHTILYEIFIIFVDLKKYQEYVKIHAVRFLSVMLIEIIY